MSRLVQDRAAKNDWTQTAHSLIAGSVAGSLGVVVGQPIDMLRVRQQIGKQQAKPTEGFFSLFRGILPPLFMTGVVSSFQFGVFQSIQGHYEKMYIKRSSELPLWTHLVAGFGAGAALSVVTSPFIIVKVQQQALGGSLTKTASHLMKMEGIKGLYRGFGAHFWADAVGRAVYMATYEALKRTAASTNNQNSTQTTPPLTYTQRLLAGAGAGMATWLAVYPADVIRSRIFALPPGKGNTLTQVGAVQRVYSEYGLMGFTRGLGLTMASAGPIAAVILPTYDYIFQTLQNRQ